MNILKYNSPSDFALSIEIEKNIADEAEARAGYYKLLKEYKSLLTSDELSKKEEIIAEELKHTIILENIIYRLNEIIPEE